MILYNHIYIYIIMVKMLKTTLGWLKSVTLSGDWGRPFYLATITGDNHVMMGPHHINEMVDLRIYVCTPVSAK